MKTKLLKFTALLIGLVFVFSLFTQSAAAVVWSDNFDDGNYDGWTVEDGDYSVTDGALRSEATGDLNNIIWYPSTTAVGTWNFSFMYDETETGIGGPGTCDYASRRLRRTRNRNEPGSTTGMVACATTPDLCVSR